MARLSDMPDTLAEHMRHLPLPAFETTPYAGGPPVARRKVAKSPIVGQPVVSGQAIIVQTDDGHLIAYQLKDQDG